MAPSLSIPEDILTAFQRGEPAEGKIAHGTPIVQHPAAFPFGWQES